MKKIQKSIFYFLLLLLPFTFLLLPLHKANASLDTAVEADVGEFYLNLSGYISPFASIVLNSNGIFMRATVSDRGGNFSISQVRIRKGFSAFCLDAVDYKRLGESVTCLKVPPATASIDKKEIFLPPTIGLSRAIIAEGQQVLVFGYSMPGAKVMVHVNDQVLSTTTDASGYYEIKLTNVKAGTYLLYSTAVYKEKPSLAPSKKLELKALNLWERIIQWIRDFIHKIIVWLSSIGLGILWLAIPILILILILLYKLWPERFSWLARFWRFFIFWKREKKKKTYASCPVWPYCLAKKSADTKSEIKKNESEEMVHIG